MRVVLDTNVLARAAGSRDGPAGELFERLCTGHLLVVSMELLAELARVLYYPRVRQMHRLAEAEIEEFIESIERGGVVVSLPAPIPQIVPHDRDDDAVVATAVAGRAQVLCTRNRHLFQESVISFGRQWSFEIMDDIELLNRLRAEKPKSE